MGLDPSREIGAKGAPTRVHQTLMEEKKGGEVMHGVAVLTIWFALNIAGMLLTMMPHIFADSCGTGRKQDQLVRVPSEEGILEEEAAMVRIGKAA